MRGYRWQSGDTCPVRPVAWTVLFSCALLSRCSSNSVQIIFTGSSGDSHDTANAHPRRGGGGAVYRGAAVLFGAEDGEGKIQVWSSGRRVDGKCTHLKSRAKSKE